MNVPMRPIWACLLVTIVVFACSSKDKTPTAEEQSEPSKEASATITPEATTEAEQIFSTRCTPCHGAQGKGDGPASAGLEPKPRNFTDPSWQSGVTDEHIEKIIVYGGAAVGKSPAMPPNPDLQAKPAVVAALRAHIRGLSGK